MVYTGKEIRERYEMIIGGLKDGDSLDEIARVAGYLSRDSLYRFIRKNGPRFPELYEEAKVALKNRGRKVTMRVHKSGDIVWGMPDGCEYHGYRLSDGGRIAEVGIFRILDHCGEYRDVTYDLLDLDILEYNLTLGIYVVGSLPEYRRLFLKYRELSPLYCGFYRIVGRLTAMDLIEERRLHGER